MLIFMLFCSYCGLCTNALACWQVRLTDALVSALELKKGKDAELAWLDAQIMVRDMSKDAKPIIMGVNDNEQEEEKGMNE